MHDGQPVLMIGQQAIKLSDINQIQIPDTNQPAVVGEKDVTPEDQLKKATGKEPEVSAKPSGNLDEVGMSQGLINKIEREAGEAS